MTDFLAQDIFNDANAAREWFESRLWPNGATCPHCGSFGEGVTKLERAPRPGLYQCNACREQFTVTVKTLMERSKIPLNIWLKAMYLLAASKKGISTNQMHRMLGVSLKSTWFLMHRIREAMRAGPFAGPLGGRGKIVEMDETYFGTKFAKAPNARGAAHKHAVLSLVERGGEVRSFKMKGLKARDIAPIANKNIDRETLLCTDEARVYNDIAPAFRDSATVNHSANEWVKRGRSDIHTNTIEGYFSIFKRGMKGVYQHCGEKHLHRYLAEFDFRYNNRASLDVNDAQRAENIAKGIAGKRLTYRRTRRGRVADASKPSA